MSRGFVYILTNPSMPGLVKIGKTRRDVEARANEISGATGVPTPFEVAHFVVTPDCDKLENRVHGSFPDVRVSDNREFFQTDLETAIYVLEDAHREIVDDWLDCFLPDHQIVHCDHFVDFGCLRESTIKAFEDHDIQSQDVPMVFYEIEVDEIRNAIMRRKEKAFDRMKEILARKADEK